MAEKKRKDPLAANWYWRGRTQEPEPEKGDVRWIHVYLLDGSWHRVEAVAEAVGDWFPTANIELHRTNDTTRTVVIDGVRDHGDRSLVLELIDGAMASPGYKIEAQTAAGPIAFHPYDSRAAAERDLPRLQRSRLPNVIRGSWKILPLEPSAAEVNAQSHTRVAGTRAALSAEEHGALAEAQRRVGRRWKTALRLAWDTGNYRDIASPGEALVSVLQRLRNASHFGPSGLAAYKRSPTLRRTERKIVVEGAPELALWLVMVREESKGEPDTALVLARDEREARKLASEAPGVTNPKAWLSDTHSIARPYDVLNAHIVVHYGRRYLPQNIAELGLN